MEVTLISRVLRARRDPVARGTAAAGLLAAACVAWSAVPMRGTGSFGTAALAAAVVCAAAGTASLAVGPEPAYPFGYHSIAGRIGLALLRAIRAAPSAEGMVIAVLVLEAMHHARPYHTGLLAVALLAFLFTTHLTESGAGPGVLRSQAPLLAAGLGLLVVVVGAAMLPVAAGPAAGWLRVLAGIAAILTGCLLLPV